MWSLVNVWLNANEHEKTLNIMFFQQNRIKKHRTESLQNIQQLKLFFFIFFFNFIITKQIFKGNKNKLF